ncbi:MAG TPA: hypothetical protein DDZ80_24355 [Cyanobacteria bacterium UBA8803]|nr:hypothetical protein [Cyanobacteria bacterium UBA9273]HBL61444.1 hypothetical protein [Cyanobacteria bacterium UBA8803]
MIFHSLADIVDVQLKAISWHHNRNANYQVAIVLKYGNDLYLNLGEGSSINKKLETVNLIRQFLKLKLQKLHI